MKTLLLTLSLAVGGASLAHAQVYQPAATRGAVLGAITGAFIGGHNHDRWAEGAVGGGVGGALLGAVVAPPEIVVSAQPAPAPVRQAAPVVYAAPVAPAPVAYAPAPQVVY